jgi:hypothetical protein
VAVLLLTQDSLPLLVAAATHPACNGEHSATKSISMTAAARKLLASTIAYDLQRDLTHLQQVLQQAMLVVQVLQHISKPGGQATAVRSMAVPAQLQVPLAPLAPFHCWVVCVELSGLSFLT